VLVVVVVFLIRLVLAALVVVVLAVLAVQTRVVVDQETMLAVLALLLSVPLLVDQQQV
jgi:hypothetical protein